MRWEADVELKPVSQILAQYIRHASARFPTATSAERDQLCLDLELLAQTEDFDLESVLRAQHSDLLIQVRRHQHHRAFQE
ncbi:MAG: hypothetical protein WD273_03845 [Trueperaceae bacterium]